MKLIEQDFLDAEIAMGVSFYSEQFLNLAKATAEQMKDYPIKTVLDYGAGTGVYADAFYQLGFEVKCFEIWKAHQEYIKANAPYLEIIDKPITTDLMLFIETSEHMTDKEIKAVFKKIKPNYILFSSTSTKTNNDEQWGHINVKSQLEWIDMFYDFGYKLSKDLQLPTSYSKLFERYEQEK